jgi:hypothetical protein
MPQWPRSQLLRHGPELPTAVRARRCANISHSKQLSASELDAVIASVAEAMAEP